MISVLPSVEEGRRSLFPLSGDDRDAPRRAEFARLYQRLAGSVFVRALRALVSVDEAEEAAALVFRLLWKEWPATRDVDGATLRALTMVACATTQARHHRPERGRESQVPWSAEAGEARHVETSKRIEDLPVSLCAAAAAHVEEGMSAEDQGRLARIFSSAQGLWGVVDRGQPLPSEVDPDVRRTLHRFNRLFGRATASAAEPAMP